MDQALEPESAEGGAPARVRGPAESERSGPGEGVPQHTSRANLWASLRKAAGLAGEALFHGQVPQSDRATTQRWLAFFLWLRYYAQLFDALRLPQRAAGLAFHTALSVIPVLVLLVSLAGALGLLESSSDAVLDLVFEQLVPVDDPSLRERAEALLKQASTGYLGSIGLIFFVYTAIALFQEVDQLFNDIWQVRHRRGIGQRVVLFWTLLTVGPPLITLSVVVSTRVQWIMQSQLGALGGTEVWAAYLFPYLLSAVVLLAVFWLLPYRRTSWRALVIGAAVTALLFELGKMGFGYYVSQFASESWFRIYGAVFLVPVLFLWMFVSWLIVACGALLAFTLDQRYVWGSTGGSVGLRARAGASTLAPLELLILLAHAFRDGLGSQPTMRLARQVGLLEEDAEELLERLEAEGYVESTAQDGGSSRGWHLRVPADTISAGAVMRALDAYRVSSHVASASGLSALAVEVERLLDHRRVDALMEPTIHQEG